MDGCQVYFTGTQTNRLDEKGRVAIPAKFRDGFEDSSNCVVVPEKARRCLVVYPPHEYEKFVDRMQKRKRKGQLTQAQISNLFAVTHRSTIDSQGRISIPEVLRGFAKLDRNVNFLGANRFLEIHPEDSFTPEDAIQNLDDFSDFM